MDSSSSTRKGVKLPSERTTTPNNLEFPGARCGRDTTDGQSNVPTRRDDASTDSAVQAVGDTVDTLYVVPRARPPFAPPGPGTGETRSRIDGGTLN